MLTMRDTSPEKIIDLIRGALEDTETPLPDFDILPETKLLDVMSGTSTAWFFMDIDEHYKISIPLEEAEKLITVGDVSQYLTQNLSRLISENKE